MLHQLDSDHAVEYLADVLAEPDLRSRTGGRGASLRALIAWLEGEISTAMYSPTALCQATLVTSSPWCTADGMSFRTRSGKARRLRPSSD